jgi:adenylate cyclase
LKIDPDAFWAQDGLGLAYVQTGQFDKGIALIREAIPKERTFALENPTTFLAYALGKAGRFAELQDLLAEALAWHEKNRRGALSIAAMYASLRESDKAFEWLEKSFEERPYMLPAAFSDFYFENVRSDPRMDALRRRLKLV